MPKLSENAVPTYRLHKQSGQGIVTLSGRDHLLGPHGSKESRAKYDRLIAEWLANGRRATYQNAQGITVSRVIAEFWAHVKTYYVTPEGTPSGEVENFRVVLAPLRRLYGGTIATEFGPRALKAVQQEMVRMGWCRTYINRQTGRLKHVFKWASSAELVPPTVYHGLLTVPGLRKDKTDAREADPVKPVPVEWVEETLKHVNRQVEAMIRLQLASGMRPGEVCSIRTCDVETTGKVWTYKPAQHKTAHHGHERVIYLGPQAQQILGDWLRPDMTAYLFSPREAEEERRTALSEKRKTPASCGNGIGTNRVKDPTKTPSDRYTVSSYRQAIGMACDAAFPPPQHLARLRVPGNGRKLKSTRWETSKEWKARLGPQKWAELQAWREDRRWHPHQLRHTAATRLRKQYGLEAARVVLGHRSSAVAEVYAEIDLTKAQQIMGEVG